jgi:predicted secreted Zn-dependent protease
MAVEYSDIEWVAYDVDGTTLADVVANIAHLPEAGTAEWHPQYDYQADEHGVVSDVTINVGWKITMPNWTGRDSASQPAQDEWDRFWSVLETHERGHLELVDTALSTLDQQMIGKSVTAAQHAWNAALAKLQQDSNAYDTANDHGRKAGTIIDLSVESGSSAGGSDDSGDSTE